MNWNSFFISGFLVWLIQLTVADSLMIDTVRPDFIGILIMYWAVKYGRFLGTISGMIFGLIIDLSGNALFFWNITFNLFVYRLLKWKYERTILKNKSFLF